MKIESYFTFLLFWTLYFSILDLWADSDQYNLWRCQFSWIFGLNLSNKNVLAIENQTKHKSLLCTMVETKSYI